MKGEKYMKKIVLMLLVLFSLNIKVQASTSDVYYSKYSDFSDYSETKIDSSELVDVEIERRYRWYKENITDEYLLYDEGISKYEFVNLENFKETEFSDWQYEQPDKITGRIIEEEEEYKVKKLKPIQTLLLRNFSFSKDVINLGEIVIYVNDKKIDYTAVCGDCGIDNTFEEDDFLLIDFYEPYYMKDITIKFIDVETEYINKFKIYAVEPMIVDIPSNIFASYTYSGSKDNNIIITEDDFSIVNPKYEEEVIYDLLPNVSSLDSVEVNMKYRYKDKHYYFYDKELEYLDEYYADYLGYKKDENDYKDYYRYRTREKIIIENEMIITRYKESLADFIISTTDYEIESNINYLKNGVYSVRYVTPFQVVEKEVTVDIEENDLRKELEEVNQKYNELIDDYNYNQQQLEQLQEFIEIKDEKISNLEKVNVEKQEYLLDNYNLIDDKEVKTLTKANEECNTRLIEMKLRNEDYEKKLKLSNQANEYLEKNILDINNEAIDIDKSDIIYFILMGLLLVLAAIFIIKKMSSKN